MDAGPMSELIQIARKRASRTSGQPYVAQSDICTCEVEIAFFSPPRDKTGENSYSTPGSTRERYSRCSAHPIS